MSLALYLQMVGRGLRPKPNGGNCLILDLAGNAAELHGLPEDERQWSLAPRGSNPVSEAPVIRCEKCDCISPAASQNCAHCGAPFGKDCPRCGVWRAWQRWSYETRCGLQHDLVCDLCHYDVHIQASLPVTNELWKLTELDDSEGDELIMEPVADLDAALRNLLEEERRRAGGADDERKSELRSLISDGESELADDDSLDKAFKQYISNLPQEEQERPRRNWPQMVQIYNDWKDALIQELAGWKDELDKLDAKVPNGRLIYNNAKDRVLQALEAQAQDAGLLPRREPSRETGTLKQFSESPNTIPLDTSKWISFIQLGEWGNIDPLAGSLVKPRHFRDANKNEVPVTSWPDLLFHTAEWLVKKGFIAKEACPITIGNRYLINTEPVNAKGTKFQGAKRQLSNGLYIDRNFSAKHTARVCEQLLTSLGQDPAQFHVLLK